MCAVGGVQSQTITVDRQMKRYQIPRLCFINKLDRTGSKPWKVLNQIRQKLKLNAAAVQIPIGLEGNLQGVIDLVENKAYYHDGPKGEMVIVKEIPAYYIQESRQKRLELIAAVADVDEVLAEYFLDEKDPDNQPLAVILTWGRPFAICLTSVRFSLDGLDKILNGQFWTLMYVEK